MEKVDSYKVDLKGVTGQVQTHNWHVDDAFFSAVQATEIQHGQLDVELKIRQSAEVYSLELAVEGQVEVTCNRCLAPFLLPIKGHTQIRAVWGDRYDDDGETVTVPREDGCFDISWHIYETAALALPLIHTHPQGECTEEYLHYQAELQSAPAATDPRWNALKKMLKQ